MAFFRHRGLLAKIAGGVFLVALIVVYFGRGPDFAVNWSREVPSKYSVSDLSAALKDVRNWSGFHHALKSAKLFRVVVRDGNEVEIPAYGPTDIEAGMRAVLEIEPTGKEWKRYQIRAELTEVRPGEKIAFRLLGDSTGKTTRAIRDLEWSVSVKGSTPEMTAKGYPGITAGDANAFTLNRRARFFGRVAAKIFMNQLYPVDLVRLANFEDNLEAKRGGFAPVYR